MKSMYLMSFTGYIFKKMQIIFLACLQFFIFYFASFEARAESLDSIIETLSNVTCETQGIAGLMVNDDYTSCLPTDFSKQVFYNTISPGLYVLTLQKLRINETDLFPQYKGGQCANHNRSDPRSPRLTFALCNNIMLQLARASAVSQSAIAIAKAALTGSDPWEEIKQIWQDKKKDYHVIYQDKEIGYTDIMPDVPTPIIFKVVSDKDTICLAAPSVFLDWLPIGCKYIKEPYPNSLYADFIGLQQDDSLAVDDYKPKDPRSLVKCATGETNCYQKAYNNSLAPIVISSPLVECAKDMVTRLLVSKDVCDANEAEGVITSVKRKDSALFKFQVSMRKLVAALLTLYVLFWGARLVLNARVPEKKEVISFVAKIILVTYFSVGINLGKGDGKDSEDGRNNGMIELVFPVLFSGVDALANLVMKSSSNNLCYYKQDDYQKNKDLPASISLLDSLDCRLTHYLGIDSLASLFMEQDEYNDKSSNNKQANLSYPVPIYVSLIVPALISGNFTLVALALAYPIMVISMIAVMINSLVMCIIFLAILGILGPLFIPMVLFNYTRGYFESWCRLLISFIFQPLVVAAFIAVMFIVYDAGFYGQCKYKSLDFKVSSSDNQSNNRQAKVFYIDSDWDNYSTDEMESCQKSLGYLLSLSFFSPQDNNNDQAGNYNLDANKDPLEGAISRKEGMFRSEPALNFSKIKELVWSLLQACVVLYLMQHFSSGLEAFAADMSLSIPFPRPSQNINLPEGEASDSYRAGGEGPSKDKISTSEASRSRDKFASTANSEKAEDKILSSDNEKLAEDKISAAATEAAEDKILVNRKEMNLPINDSVEKSSDLASERNKQPAELSDNLLDQDDVSNAKPEKTSVDNNDAKKQDKNNRKA